MQISLIQCKEKGIFTNRLYIYIVSQFSYLYKVYKIYLSIYLCVYSFIYNKIIILLNKNVKITKNKLFYLIHKECSFPHCNKNYTYIQNAATLTRTVMSKHVSIFFICITANEIFQIFGKLFMYLHFIQQARHPITE